LAYTQISQRRYLSPSLPTHLHLLLFLPLSLPVFFGLWSRSIQADLLNSTQGITFLDIFPILRLPHAFETLITHLLHHILITHPSPPDVIVGLDARGFLLGPVLAMRLGAAFVPVRKGGKLPGSVEVVKYEKEYGIDVFEMQSGAVEPGQKCIVVE